MLDLKLGCLMTGWRVEDGLLCFSIPLLFHKHTGEECHDNKVYLIKDLHEKEKGKLFIFRKF